jgi:hypothetical protein
MEGPFQLAPALTWDFGNDCLPLGSIHSFSWLMFVTHSQYCLGMILSSVHAFLIEPPPTTHLLMFLTIASLLQLVKRLLLALVGIEDAICIQYSPAIAVSIVSCTK